MKQKVGIFGNLRLLTEDKRNKNPKINRKDTDMVIQLQIFEQQLVNRQWKTVIGRKEDDKLVKSELDHIKIMENEEKKYVVDQLRKSGDIDDYDERTRSKTIALDNNEESEESNQNKDEENKSCNESHS